MRGQGVVVSIGGNKASIQVSGAPECRGCPSQGHCHSGTTKPRTITVINDCGAKVHDCIVFDAEAHRVILSAFLLWIVPVLAMFVGYVVGQRFAGGLIPIATAFAFLALAFGVLKIINQTLAGGTAFYPRITRILPPHDHAETTGSY